MISVKTKKDCIALYLLKYCGSKRECPQNLSGAVSCTRQKADMIEGYMGRGGLSLDRFRDIWRDVMQEVGCFPCDLDRYIANTIKECKEKE